MKILHGLLLLLSTVSLGCNFSNRMTFNEKSQCIEVQGSSSLKRFDISTSDGLYFFQLIKGVKSSRFCFHDFEEYYFVKETNPDNLRKKFKLPKNGMITFNNNSYGDMASFEIMLFVDSSGSIRLVK